MVINCVAMKAEMKKLLVISVIIIWFCGEACADLAGQIDGIINRPSEQKVQYSIHIVKADSGETVYSHNASKALIPASNMKIITTAAALEYLGANYEYKTKVGLCGDTLIITGSGDPLLGDRATDAKYGREDGWIFKDIAAALKKKNIKTVKDIIVDSSIFDDERVHPSWPKEELNRWYACEVSGLNFNGNCIDVRVENTSDRAVVFIEPETKYVEVINKVVPISKGKSTVGAYRQEKPNQIVVRGKCRNQAGPFSVAIERPSAFFGFLLAENLGRAGIKTKGQLLGKITDKNRKIRELAEYKTSIADCLARCNKDSFGLAAEALVKTIAANNKRGGKDGSWEQGRELISRYLLRLGIEKEEFYIDDGSGLSRENKLSANAITKVLLDVYKSKNWQLYKNSLAVGGGDGTISKYFKEEQYRGKVFGKTGYINKVKTFSGICSSSGGDYIFSILANNTDGQTRAAINDIAKAIIDSE